MGKHISVGRAIALINSVERYGYTKTAIDWGISATSVQRRLREARQMHGLELNKGEKRILEIGDLHAPFIKKGYLEFCKSIYDKYQCNEVVFLGDIIDNHYTSFHATDPDGHSAAREFELAKEEIAKWYAVFPKAKVCLGNHDELPDRKAFSAGISKTWLKPIGEVLETPNWEFAESWIINDILYIHGTGKKARNRAKDDFMRIVQGHYHSESYIDWFVGERFKFWAKQLGCGVDRHAYAMAYGKHFKKMHINCGVTLGDAMLPIIEYMPL